MELEAATQTQPQLQQAQLMALLPVGSVGSEGAVIRQLAPAKREPEDEVQFLSSHPVKKQRSEREVAATNDRHAPRTEAEVRPPTPRAAGLDDASRVDAPASLDGSKLLDRRSSAAPLGLASHLSSHAMWDNRGASLPTMENFSFQKACAPTSTRPPSSVAVSPRHVPQALTPFAGEEDTSQNSLVPNLDSVMAGQASLENTTSLAPPLVASSSTVPAGGPPAGPDYAQSTYPPMNIGSQAHVPFAMYPMAHPGTLSHMYPPANLSSMSMMTHPWTIGQGLIPHQGHPGVGGRHATGNAVQPAHPALTSVSHHSTVNHTPTVSLMTVPTPGSEHLSHACNPPMPRKVTCLACLAACQRGGRAPAQTQAQHQAIPGHHEAAHSHQQARHGVIAHFPHQLNPSGLRPPSSASAASNQQSIQGTTSKAGASSPNTQLNWQSRHPASMNGSSTSTNFSLAQGLYGGGATAPFLPASCHSGAGISVATTGGQHGVSTAMNNTSAGLSRTATIHDTAHRTMPAHHHQTPVPPIAITQPAPTPTPSPSPRKTVAPSSTPKPQPSSSRPLLPPPPPQQQPPLSIPAARASAAAHMAARARGQHAQNLLVDVAETVSEIFPYELTARRHGCAAHKVVEALAAVVQVPLLRCASDKRRAGKLGSERMREMREARKGWAAREKGRGKEGEKEQEEDGEAAVPSMLPVGPGPQPSVFDIASLLGPVDMPGFLMGDGVFTGQW